MGLLLPLLSPGFPVPESNHLASTLVPLPAFLKPQVRTEAPGPPPPAQRWTHPLSLALCLPWPLWLLQTLSGFFPPQSCLGGRRVPSAMPTPSSSCGSTRENLALEAVLPGSSHPPVTSTPPLCQFEWRRRVPRAWGREKGVVI